MSAELRVGQGIDAHRFSEDPDRRLVLCGHTLPEGPGLAGHSDGDVALHAVADALLGAAGLGDLGERFGTAAPEHAGAASAGLLAAVLGDVAAAGWTVVNTDLTVVAEHPRLAPHRPALRRGLAGLLALGEDAVSVKATSTDGLGAIGAGEGIAACAVVLLRAAAAGM